MPAGCTEVDVFLVGGGGGSGNGSGAGSGYTKTYKRNNIGIKQGSQISVTPGQEINIIVGKGGAGLYYGYPEKGGFSQFMNSSYRADGGNPSGNIVTSKDSFADFLMMLKAPLISALIVLPEEVLNNPRLVLLPL